MIDLPSERERLLPFRFCRSGLRFRSPFLDQRFQAPDVLAVFQLQLASFHVIPRHVSVLSVCELSTDRTMYSTPARLWAMDNREVA